MDMQSIDALADALNKFKGGVDLVSHDSRLISRACKNEARYGLSKNRSIEAFPGSFEEYKDELEREIREDPEEVDN